MLLQSLVMQALVRCAKERLLTQKAINGFQPRYSITLDELSVIIGKNVYETHRVVKSLLKKELVYMNCVALKVGSFTVRLSDEVHNEVLDELTIYMQSGIDELTALDNTIASIEVEPVFRKLNAYETFEDTIPQRKNGNEFGGLK